jgi:hypothetical protein
VVLGDGDYTDTGDFPVPNTPIDNYQNAVWNHLYIYTDTEGSFSCTAGNVGGHCFALAEDPDAECDSSPGAGDGVCGINSLDANKLRLGLHVAYPTNFGPAGHGMEGLLTFTGDTGTVVFTQMKVLENLPITLTSPRIWEALGLPLTPFEDSIGFFQDPGSVDEDSVRPYVEMKAQLYEADCDAAGVCVEGPAVMDSGGNPVIGFGTAPIDIPNCERCHSAFDTQNSPNNTVTNPAESALVQQEINFWLAYYPTMKTGSDWYARLKGAAVSILARHDAEHGTDFLGEYPGVQCSLLPDPINDADVDGVNDPACGPLQILDPNGDGNPGANTPALVRAQNTRAGHESVICQKCHADNVIAVVKSANCGPTLKNDGSGDWACSETAADELFSNIAPTDPVTGDGHLIPPLTEAIHHNHREFSEGGPIHFEDSLGRSGGCQGCHPAHRSDGDMAGYPIDLDGNNFYADLDNRDANGGCFVGRDVHSNPTKDIDGAETPSHLNPVGSWLQTNVANDSGSWKGIWCTNCHSQASQQLWKAENVADLVNAQPGDPGHVREPAGDTLTDVVNAVNTALSTTTSVATFQSWLDPKGKRCVGGATPDAVCYVDGDCGGGTCEGLSPDGVNHTSAIWAPDPGICDYVAGYLNTGGGQTTPAQDGGVATIEVAIGSLDGSECSTGGGLPGPDCGLVPDGAIPDGADFFICGSGDNPTDGDINVSLLAGGLTSEDGSGTPCDPETEDPCFAQSPFCTTADCVAAAQDYLADNGYTTTAFPVPFSAASDGRDHWLAPGEPHCADCHSAPYVEQSGNINAFPPFNYPRKASLMRYSRGHQDITCQGCHESIHGLYPVTPTIDTTTYAQAASLNSDDSHGPLKCGTCHDVGQDGIPTWVSNKGTLSYNDQLVSGDFDAAVSWMHTYTEEANPLAVNSVCYNCHGVKGNNWDVVSATNKKWVQHAYRGRVSRSSMDSVELQILGDYAGGGVPGSGDADDPLTTVCLQCHRERHELVTCDTANNQQSAEKWKNHLIEGRVAEEVWIDVSNFQVGDTCGW